MAGFLEEMGAVVIDADKIVHQLYLPEAEGFRQVVNLFGASVLDGSNHLNRRRIADIVFADKIVLAKLNAIIHPLVMQQIKLLLMEHRRRHTSVVVIEAALLIEANWVPMVDEVWVTTAPRAVIMRRLNLKYGMSYSAVLARIHAQLPVREQIKRAAVVVNTDTSPELLKSKVQRLWKSSIQPARTVHKIKQWK